MKLLKKSHAPLLILYSLVAVLIGTLEAPPEAPSQRPVPAVSRAQGESVNVPTMAAHRRLERRVKANEERLKALVGAQDNKRRKPDADEPDEDDTPRSRTTRGPPRLGVVWVPRNGPTDRFALGHGEVSQVDRQGLAFRLYKQRVDGLDAWMVTVAAINGYAGRGAADFHEFRITQNGKTLEAIRGRHRIIPRGAIIRRFYLGPDAEEARGWGWVSDPRPAPSWANAQALAELGKFSREVGPYRFYWPDVNLGNTHGGQGIGPFHGGPDDWLTTPGGRRLREHQMLAAFQRPIWLLGDAPEEPYWMGRTTPHRLKGYNQVGDDWCPYGKKLDEVRFADHTHLSRNTAGAAALAKWDLFARDCLLTTFRDFQAANSLTRPVVQGNHLLWPLWKKVEAASGPHNSEGDRGLAHQLRLMRWCRPYLPAEELEPYEKAFRTWVGKMASVYGYTRTSGGVVGSAKHLVPPHIQAFHQQLNLFEFQHFGGLDHFAELLGQHLTPQPAWWFEARDGGPHETALDRNGSEKPSHAAYGAMTHGVLIEYETPAELLAANQGRGVNGSSQDLDNVPRWMWEPGL